MGARVILSVEDDDGAFHLLKVAFHETDPSVQLVRACDGVEALAFLTQSGPHHNAPRPDLVLLNINLPKKNGMEVLADIAASESLRTIPVVIFTSSELRSEKAHCLALGAQEFLTKPADFDGLLDAVRSACAHAGN